MQDRHSLIITLVLSFLTSCSLASVIKRQQHNDNPFVDGSPDQGWKYLPSVTDAWLWDWVLDEGTNATIPLYISAIDSSNYSSIKRAVIVMPAKGRDPWGYFNSVNNALYSGAYDDPNLDRNTISIMAPGFLTELDLQAGAAKPSYLLWGKTTWVSGHNNVAPAGVTDFSSYKVIDILIDFYMNRDIFQNLEVVVVAGHSAGAQMVQRYAALRSPTTNDDRLRFWTANPGSLLWLTTDRPAPNANCDGVDDYKYGLESKIPAYAMADYNSLGRDGIVERYLNRHLNYAWGLADNGAGDTRCQAVTQGASHLERGENFVSMLKDLNSGMIPSAQTVDYVPGVSHDGDGMMSSAQGINRLFQAI